MEFSSPRLPTATPSGSKPYNGGIESSTNIATKRQTRGWDNIDDSSSVASMSSTNPDFKPKCCLCKDSETPISPLVRCSRCKRRWHEHCHKPMIEDPKIKDWSCRHCIDKMSASSRPSPTAVGSMSHSLPSPNLTSESSKEPNKMESSYTCEAPGCKAFLFHKPSTPRVLCTIHAAVDRYKNSMEKPVASKTSAPKPFRKDKLYPVKLDEGMKTLKRKRASTGRRATTSTDQDVDPAQTSVEMPQQLEMRSPVISGTSPAKMTPRKTPQERTRLSALTASTSSDKSPNEDEIAHSLGSASMAESPIEPATIDWEANDLLPNSARRTPQLLEHERAIESPEYEPPPPPSLDYSTNPWVSEEDRDDSPGSQIAQELRATVDGHEAPKDATSTSVLKAYRSPYAAALPSIEERTRKKSSPVQLNPRSGDVPTISSSEDREMPDVDGLSINNTPKETSAPIATVTSVSQQLASSMTTTLASATISEDTDTDMNRAPEESGPEPHPDSVEAKRRRKAAAYDSSVLDSFLAKQRNADPDVQPTAQELFKTQIWGHIDPRVVWPKEQSAEWLEEKRREIDARGGKKANFGKLLTAQVRKERRDNGWGIHQRKDIVHTERTDEHKKHLEELLGIKDLDEFEPGVRDGQLVMIEKMVDQNGKRKRKGAPRIYPV